MLRCVFRRVIVKDDQAVDCDPGLRIDQKWIDIDRGDAAVGIRNQI